MSRNAIKGSLPIKGKNAEYHASCIISNIHKFLEVDACTLGSTGKKLPLDESGDIDIAIRMDFTPENIEKVEYWLYQWYGKDIQIYVSHGFKIISYGLEYFDKTSNIDSLVQVDLMFSDNLEYSKFMYHSPNYKNNESNFKGLYRTNLLVYMAGRVPTYIDDIYDTDGNLMDYWKYTLTYDKGLVLTHKTYRGKTKRLSKPVTVKEDTKLITTDVPTIIKFILGISGSEKDINSYESLIKFMFSSKYKFNDNKEIVINILNDYFTDPRQNSKSIELIQYINNIVNNNVNYCDILKNNLLEFLCQE